MEFPGSVESRSIDFSAEDWHGHEGEHRQGKASLQVHRAAQASLPRTGHVRGSQSRSRSGYYEWLYRPLSDRAIEDARLLRLIRKSFVASHGIYGAPRVFRDLREAGETCGKHRVERLMRENNLRAAHGDRTR